jgi:hypothetical protein
LASLKLLFIVVLRRVVGGVELIEETGGGSVVLKVGQLVLKVGHELIGVESGWLTVRADVQIESTHSVVATATGGTRAARLALVLTVDAAKELIGHHHFAVCLILSFRGETDFESKSSQIHSSLL